MNDRQIIEYLRARGQVTPPVDFTRSVMAAVDATPAQRSRFSAYLPAFVAVGAVAVIAVLALLVGPGRDIGPAPSPSATAETATLAELETAVDDAIERLADSPGVQGRGVSYVGEHVGSVSWFDWRANGDQVAVHSRDIDVADTAWWLDPGGEPPATSERIQTLISVLVGDDYYASEDGAWTMSDRRAAPIVLAYGIGILTGEIRADLDAEGSPPGTAVSRRELDDGGVVWTLTGPGASDAAVYEWHIEAEGRLASIATDVPAGTLDPQSGLRSAYTRMTVTFTPLVDPEPIPTPDVDAAPDPAVFGMPDDFPFGEPTRRTGSLETAVAEAVAQLAGSPGVQGVVTSTIGEYLASATWFDWRPNGDQVVVTRSDIDVSAPWWTDPDGEPLTVGERIDTDISVAVGDEFYRAEGDTWVVEGAPGPLTFWTGVLEGTIPAVGGFPADAQEDRRDLADGTTVWVMVSGSEDARTITEWTVDPDGLLALVSIAVEQAPSPEEAGSTTTTVEFSPLDDVDPIPTPDISTPPDPTTFGLPDDFPHTPPVALNAVQLRVCPFSSAPFVATIPEGWWTNTAFEHPELGAIPACQYFAPERFNPTTATRDELIPEGVAVTINHYENTCLGYINPILEERTATVDGYPARIVELAQGKDETDPPGQYQYEIALSDDTDCDPGGRFIVGRTSVDMTGVYEANKAILDEMMSTIRIEP